MNAQPSLDFAQCRVRQTRLCEIMRERKLDAALITQQAHVYYLTGVRFAWTFQPAALLTAEGKLTLVAPQKAPEQAAADEVITYEAKRHSTMRNDQRAASAQVLKAHLGTSRFSRLGVEFADFSRHYDGLFDAIEDLEPELYRLRRRKDADELALLRKAIAATETMYARAREIIAPGVNELDLFNELQSVAVREYGEMLTGTGNDYQCNARGGAPRNRIAQAGELWILDLGPAYRGYFADNARTIAVTEPTQAQLAAWEAIQPVFRHIEATVRPGVSCKQLFDDVQTMLDRAPHGKFNHHLGHGIGLFPHEGPHLNPYWDDTFAEGDVFTAEPGLYAPELNAGMRLENDYLVTADGVVNLSPFPMELRKGPVD